MQYARSLRIPVELPPGTTDQSPPEHHCLAWLRRSLLIAAETTRPSTFAPPASPSCLFLRRLSDITHRPYTQFHQVHLLSQHTFPFVEGLIVEPQTTLSLSKKRFFIDILWKTERSVVFLQSNSSRNTAGGGVFELQGTRQHCIGS
jgi:hypothetical protein